MKTLNITQEEYRILTNPTRIEEWGAQQAVARKVQAQVIALTDEQVTIDAFDIAAMNKAIEVNREGAFIPSASALSGGWPVTEWEVSTASLKRAATTCQER